MQCKAFIFRHFPGILVGGEPVTLRVLLFEEIENTWVAQCLEYDIVAQGPSMVEAQEAFEKVFRGEVSIGNLSKISRSPEKYWKLWREHKRCPCKPKSG